MNFIKLISTFAFALPISLIACASTTEDQASDDAADEALSARDQLQGSWTNESGGLDLRPSGAFFWDSNGARKEGSWKADKRTSTLTIKVGSQETVYRYIYKPVHILNGFPA